MWRRWMRRRLWRLNELALVEEPSADKTRLRHSLMKTLLEFAALVDRLQQEMIKQILTFFALLRIQWWLDRSLASFD